MRSGLGRLNRSSMIDQIERCPDHWEVLIIGGGATGLGAAVDAASRGFRTLLIEQHDFAKATSSRSTKLIHGGLRYLQQGNIALVTEALKERGILCKNAPHLIHHLPFLVPIYHWWEGPFYGIGLKLYDLLAGKLGIEKSTALTRRQTLRAIPTLEPKGLRGGVCYYDGQFDDSRLAITLAQTAADHGATLLNYFKAVDLIKKEGICIGIEGIDQLSGKRYKLYSKSLINATGIFTDELRKKDHPRESLLIAPSQGVHLVLDRSFMPGNKAILVPHTEDGRVIFMVPWHDKVLIGTTDTAVKKPVLEPKPMQKEIEFLLSCTAQYLIKDPKKSDILSMFAGLRPLIKSKGKNTAALSRDHTVVISSSGLVTIAGGKWTTYRKMGQDAVTRAIAVGGLAERPCLTHSLRLHGYQRGLDPLDRWSPYGSDAKKMRTLIRKSPYLGKKLHPNLPYLAVDVVWAARYEMAQSVEDVLARRTRALFLDAKASLEMAPAVVKLLAKELKKNQNWQKKELAAFSKLVKQYLPKSL